MKSPILSSGLIEPHELVDIKMWHPKNAATNPMKL